MYLSGSINGDTGTGGGLYPFFFTGWGALVDVPAEASAEISGVDDAALIAKIRDNPTPPLPPPYLN